MDWMDEAISIIDDMQRECIVDYEQAREFRMRVKIKGTDEQQTDCSACDICTWKIVESPAE